jgi:hypothetical protein
MDDGNHDAVWAELMISVNQETTLPTDLRHNSSKG